MNAIPLNVRIIPSAKISPGHSVFRRSFFTLIVTLAGLALSAPGRAQLPSPSPDGGYPNRNTAEGDGALFSLDTAIGADNTAIGFEALHDVTASGNTAVGSQALTNNTDGASNTAAGYSALASNTTGAFNTAIGTFSLVNNVSGTGNTATGQGVLRSNTEGSSNTGNGVDSLGDNTSGSANTAIGRETLVHNTIGASNTATGNRSLFNNTTGNFNTAIGFDALSGNDTGKFNIAIGARAGLNLTTGNRNIDIGHRGVAGEEKTTRIGNIQTRAFIAGIRGRTTSKGNAVPVVIDSDGQLGTVSSSRRFKNNIKPMGEGSEAILGLQPVTFNYKTDQSDTPQFGLIAEEVAKVNPDLVVRDDDRSIYTVRYEAVNAMLLNEFLKAHREMQELKNTVAEQQQQIKALAEAAQVQVGKARAGRESANPPE